MVSTPCLLLSIDPIDVCCPSSDSFMCERVKLTLLLRLKALGNLSMSLLSKIHS
jgi:hypothetical protein